MPPPWRRSSTVWGPTLSWTTPTRGRSACSSAYAVAAHTPGASLPEDVIRELWRDWRYLLGVGVETGQMLTMDGLDEDAQRRARRNRADRHWVYKREGLPCRICGTHIVLEVAAARKLYYCPSCQQ